ncbi:unnamed protein product [Phytophthora lilii]|uniref:Hexosyltransferase n=1 Tax=Phytophthora lilii TaxID=2077276 RepID=A0A9W6TVC3_9STRA|nr:unnamed protein product [Phytophthora lilii]
MGADFGLTPQNNADSCTSTLIMPLYRQNVLHTTFALQVGRCLYSSMRIKKIAMTTLTPFHLWLAVAALSAASCIAATSPRLRGEAATKEFVSHGHQQHRTVLGNVRGCFELSGIATRCSPVLDSNIEVYDLPGGQYTVRAYITDAAGSVRHHETNDTAFTVVSEDSYTVYATDRVEKIRKAFQLPRDMNLLQWAHQHHTSHETMLDGSVLGSRSSQMHKDNPVLVIGIKTAVLTNFARRQAIRETWALEAAKHHVEILFLGCRPNMHDVLTYGDRQRLRDALVIEKQVYGDLLTDELDCEDGYETLAEKVKAFFRFVVAVFTETPFVMVADDDIFLRVNKLVQVLDEKVNKNRVYTGQAWSSMFSRSSTPIREQTHKNYLPEEQYPLNEFLPYAFGPHYILSMDCVRFISKNYWRLQSLNGLEDVSVGLWLLVMQVHLEHTQAFLHLTLQLCRDNLISLAELSPLGVRIIHANIRRGKGACYGFDRLTWNYVETLSPLEMLSSVQP